MIIKIKKKIIQSALIATAFGLTGCFEQLPGYAECFEGNADVGPIVADFICSSAQVVSLLNLGG